MSHPPSRSPAADIAPLVLLSTVVTALVILTSDPAGDAPRSLEGPGLTLDESFNVEEGVRLVTGLQEFTFGSLTLRQIFGEESDLPIQPPLGYHNPDHPPLGRVWLGLFHSLSQSIHPVADNPGPFVTLAARTGSAVAFGLLVFIVGYTANQWYGRAGGIIAALSLVLMPRVFGHAHLAALETVIGLAYTVGVLSLASRWQPARSVSTRTAIFTGCLFGLALLTKIQAILLPIPVALWALWHGRHRAIVPLLLWAGAGLLLFFALWPWLWIDPVSHFREYLSRATERREVYVWYFGQRIADHAVPWHYPAVMFLTTIPIGLQLFGLIGLGSRRCSLFKEPREQLVLGCLVFPLLLFSLPGVAVYDGTRLFLVVFPLWAVFIGKGGAAALGWLRQRTSNKIAIPVMTLMLAAQGYGLFQLHPCYLSYYNVAVGGLRGADRLGLTTTYWRDSLTRSLLGETSRLLPAGATVVLVPVLHPAEVPTLLSQSPILRQRGIALRRWDEVADGKRKYVLVHRRQADIPPILEEMLPDAKVLAEVKRDGVQLAALYDLRP